MKNARIKNSLIISLFILLFNNVFAQKANTIKYENLYKDTANYLSKKADLNSDGKLDVVFYNKWFVGNDMYFFINDEKKYNLTLKTINFSSDASYKIEKIEPIFKNKDNIVLKIHTLSANKEDIKSIHYIIYKNNKWYLKKTECDAMIYNLIKDKIIHYKCIYQQNILLSEDVNFKLFDSKDKNCLEIK